MLVLYGLLFMFKKKTTGVFKAGGRSVEVTKLLGDDGQLLARIVSNFNHRVCIPQK